MTVLPADVINRFIRGRSAGQIDVYPSSDANSEGPSPSAGALLTAVRTARDVIDVAWYMLLTVVSRRHAMRILRRSEWAWERDASSRTSKDEAR
jgi:hypothetical protein